MRSRARGPSALSPRRRRALRELRQPSPRPSAPAAARRAYKACVRGARAGGGDQSFATPRTFKRYTRRPAATSTVDASTAATRCPRIDVPHTGATPGSSVSAARRIATSRSRAKAGRGDQGTAPPSCASRIQAKAGRGDQRAAPPSSGSACSSRSTDQLKRIDLLTSSSSSSARRRSIAADPALLPVLYSSLSSSQFPLAIPPSIRPESALNPP